jgi:hypothetical protein
MSLLVLQAYSKLVHFDFYLARGNFAALYQKVRDCQLGAPTALPDVAERICAAVDMACIWYWREGALPAEVSRDCVSAETLRSPGSDDDRRTTNAVQGPRLGRGRWPCGQ